MTAAAAGASAVVAVDLDADGDVDVISAAPTDNAVTWHENDGQQSFTAVSLSTSATGAYAVHVSDVDLDGDTDVIVASTGDDTVAWYENRGENTFGVYEFDARVVTTLADYAASVTAADVDGDADADVVVGSYLDDTVAWHENDGSESFVRETGEKITPFEASHVVMRENIIRASSWPARSL